MDAPPTELPTPNLAQRIALGLTIVAIWAASHRYGGIWHDGVLYAGQALYRLHPEHFAGDLFFVHGSQDSFSIFGPIYALLVSTIGLGYAALAVVIPAQLAWIAAAALLARAFLQGLPFWLALLLIAVVPRIYGSDEVFAYAETFATARLVAEPLVLAGLALLVAGRRIGGNALLFCGALFHPVIAFPGIVAAFAMQATPRITLGLTAAGLLFALVAATGRLGVLPPLQVMDADWYRISQARSPFVFIDQWKPAELGESLFWGALLFLAARTAAGVTRRFWVSVLFAGLVGFALAAIAAYSPVALLVQMQTWRAAWLVKVTGILAAVWLAHTLWPAGKGGRLLLLALLACYLKLDEWGAYAGAMIAVLYPAAARSRSLSALCEGYHAPIAAGIALASSSEIVLAFQELLGALGDLTKAYASDFPRMSMLAIEQSPMLWLLLGSVSLYLVFRWWAKTSLRVGACIMLALIILTAGLSWSRIARPGARLLSPYAEAPSQLRSLIPPGSVSYLDGSHAYLWFALDRASYASHHQAAGVIFSRGTAIEAERRLHLTAALGSRDGHLDWRPPSRPTRARPVPGKAVLALCQDPKLDFVVLTRPLDPDDAIRPMATIPVKFQQNTDSVIFNVFDCPRLRN